MAISNIGALAALLLILLSAVAGGPSIAVLVMQHLKQRPNRILLVTLGVDYGTQPGGFPGINFSRG
jgi:hypothetical protein